MQNTSQILMIRPVRFAYNPQTAVNNAFQKESEHGNVQDIALAQFDNFVQILRANGVDVLVREDSAEPHTPDAIFPNNWISFHGDTIFLYPMYAENRRLERDQHLVQKFQEDFGITVVHDLSYYESESLFLEGTGSMVLDRENKIAYACISPRTNEQVLETFCRLSGYKAVLFYAYDDKHQLIYHTNVMMCVADKYVVVCLDALSGDAEKAMLVETIQASGKVLLEIDFGQMNSFAGNMLQVANREGERLLVMSTSAYNALNPEQITFLEAYNRIVHADLSVIEQNGGGSARCMMAEVFK